MENSAKTAPLSPEQAVSRIRAAKPDPTKFKIRHRGFIDWKFGELAEYKGFEAAVQYAEAAAAWANRSAEGSLLLETYRAFREAEKEVSDV